MNGMGSLLGRKSVLAQAGGALDDALRGVGQLLLVCGEPGIGKTALLAELAAQARARGALVLRGTCWDGTGAPPYWPWVQVLRGAGVELVDFAPAGPAAITDAGARFTLFDRVVRLLTGLGPLVVVLDDLQWADEPSLRLLEFTARQLVGHPIFVVGAYRDVEASGLLRRVAGAGQVLPLAGLARDDVGALMTAVGGTRPDDDVIADVWHRTGGNPFFVREVTRLLLAQGAGQQTVPDTVRDTCERRIARLPQPCVDLLVTASVAGIELRLDLLARLHPEADHAELIDEAVRARVLVVDAVGRHRFAHDLFRQTLESALPASRREQLHADVGRALEALRAAGAEVHPAELAAHFLAGRSSVAAEGVHYSAAAAEEALARLGYEDAVGHYERALAGLDRLDPPNPTRRVRVLIGLADARNRAGDAVMARAECDRAAHLARRIGDTDGLARAALARYALGARTPSAHAANIELLSEAAEKLPPGPSALRARVLTALVGSQRHGIIEPDRARLTATAEEAVRAARSAGEPAALAAALLAQHDAAWRPGAGWQRLEILDQMHGAAAAAGDRDQVARAHQLRAAALIELGDPRGRIELETYAELAEQLGHARGRWEAMTRRATLAAILGRFGEADRLCGQAYALGQGIGEPDAIGVYGTLRTSLLLLAGRTTSLPDPALEASAPLRLAVPLLRTASLLACADQDAAGEELTGFAVDQIPSTFDLELLAIAAAVIAPVGSDAQRGQLLERLRPYAGLHAIVGGCASYWGAVDQHLGALAVALGRRDEATAHLRSAIQGYERFGAPAWAERCRAQLDQLTAAPQASNVFRCDGATWTLAFSGVEVHLPDAKGLRDIATLLAAPGRAVPATALLGMPPAPAVGADPILDDTAKAAYRARLAELQDEIDEAVAWSDDHRADRARTERELLVRELSAAVGLGGRDRRLGDVTERARKTVTARIRDTLQRVDQAHPALAEHLRAALRTGTSCTYEPAEPTRWQL